ncbi:MAG: hypothetical protein RLY31_3177, partial [Bacteroidota bacterium]
MLGTVGRNPSGTVSGSTFAAGTALAAAFAPLVAQRLL